MIKIGVRKNLIYPSMLLLCITLRRIIEIFFLQNFINELGNYLLPFLIFFSQFVFGLLFTCCFSYKQKSNKINKILGIQLIHAKIQISELSSDSQITTFILIFFASYFNCLGTLIRKNKQNDFEGKTLYNRLRSFQIIISSVLCCCTLRTKLYRHNIFTLVIIFICSIIIIIVFFFTNKGKDNSILLYTIISCFLRAFLDTTEKYLFEFDYVSPFKMLMQEGLVSCFILLVILVICEIFCLNIWPNQKKTDSQIDAKLKKGKNIERIILSIFLLVLYWILSGFKNIYRVITIKLYSPMTRALAETIIDPFIVFYYFIDENIKPNILYIVINLICLFLIVFCSLVYNDFIILYCFGLEHNTYTEIKKRSELNDYILGEEDNDNDSDDGETVENKKDPVND